MKATIQPSKVTGTVRASASKSAMQRACAAALLKGGKTILLNPGFSDDDKAALHIIQQLGATVTQVADEVHISSTGLMPVSNTLNCGESGLSVRMFTPIAALHAQEMFISGEGSLLKRPLNFFDEVLPQLGVNVNSNKGFLPLKIQGPMQPKNITIDGSLSSQYLTGLLMAFASAGATNATICVTNLASKPYIDITLSVLKDFGFKLPVNNNYKSFYFDEKKPSPIANTMHYTVEGDWSGAAFLLVAAAINGNVVLTGIDAFSSQADKAILIALMAADVTLSIEQHEITVNRKELKAFHFNATDCPDLFPPLVALAAYCNGTSVIEGVSRLKHKESNRGQTLQEEFGKLGITINLQDDLMIVKGGGVKQAIVHSQGDHRIAMACAVAALGADGEVQIEGAEAVNKSYPRFWNHLQSLGANVSLTHNK